jgi:hypothetical protein
MNLPTWSISSHFKLTILFHSHIWLQEHRNEISKWLDSENVEYNLNHKVLFLDNTKQIEYFILKWRQDEI